MSKKLLLMLSMVSIVLMGCPNTTGKGSANKGSAGKESALLKGLTAGKNIEVYEALLPSGIFVGEAIPPYSQRIQIIDNGKKAIVSTCGKLHGVVVPVNAYVAQVGSKDGKEGILFQTGEVAIEKKGDTYIFEVPGGENLVAKKTTVSSVTPVITTGSGKKLSFDAGAVYVGKITAKTSGSPMFPGTEDLTYLRVTILSKTQLFAEVLAENAGVTYVMYSELLSYERKGNEVKPFNESKDSTGKTQKIYLLTATIDGDTISGGLFDFDVSLKRVK